MTTRCSAATSRDFNRTQRDNPSFDGRCRRAASMSVRDQLLCREHAALETLKFAIEAGYVTELPESPGTRRFK